MTTISELLDEIKSKCPEQTMEIDTLISNIDKTILSKSIINKSKPSSVGKPKSSSANKSKKTLKKSSNKIEDIKSFLKDKSNKDITIEYNQTNPKQKSSKAYERYEIYKTATSIGDAKKQGASLVDMVNDYNKGILKVMIDKSSSESSVKSLSKPSDQGIPFSSIEGCGHIEFTDDNLELIRKDSFLKSSKHFKEIVADGDGNCGYHSVIQGLIESYYILGNESNDNLKQFIKDIKEKLKLDPKQIVSDNRKNNKITIPRQVVNHFRRFILDIEAPPELRPPMADGTLKHVFERENEVAEYPYDGDKEEYLTTKRPQKHIDREKKK